MGEAGCAASSAEAIVSLSFAPQLESPETAQARWAFPPTWIHAPRMCMHLATYDLSTQSPHALTGYLYMRRLSHGLTTHDTYKPSLPHPAGV